MVESIMVSSHHSRVIAAVKAIQALDAETGQEHPIGYLCISYDPEVFHRKFQITGQSGQIYRLVDQRDRILCDPDMKNVGKTLDPLLKNHMNAQTGQFHADMDGQDTQVFYDRSEDTGWVLMSFIQTARVDEQITAIAGSTFWALGFCAALAIFFILHFSRKVVSPIRNITARFKEIQAGRPESELHLTAISRNEIGELVRWFNTFLDNQAEKRRTEEELIRSQAELRRSYELLEKRVADRTQELNAANQALRNEITERQRAENERQKLETQLRQSQKMEAIGTLAGGIAHDFNNILSPIMGYTELVLDKVEKGSQIEENLQAVYTAGKRARDLVNQILVVARQSETERKPLQVSIAVKEALKLLRASIPASIEIVQRIESDSLIMGDFTHIHQIVINMCTNALHAMEDTGGRLSVSLSDIRMDHAGLPAGNHDKQPGDSIRLTIADTGTGIAPDLLDKIFMPYYTTKGIGKGTGMGLAIVHGIIESYGGIISVESELGHGTIFTIDLPVIPKQNESIAHIQEPLPTGTEHILIVDDEPQIAKMLSLMLNSLGYRVTIRSSSTEALAFVKSGVDPVDLVFTDMTMPQMSGEQLAAEIMKIGPGIPIILSTGYSRRISKETTAEKGIKALLLKPVSLRDLAHTVRKILDAGVLRNQNYPMAH
jgi:signal transduction histidine kinase/ActR/RegA family two-component response regulator